MDIKSYLDTIHYKVGYYLELFIKNKNHNHVIIYGISNSGKTTLIKTLFKDIYSPTKIIIQPFPHEMNQKYYYFDLKKISNKSILIEYIQEIIRSYDHFNHSKYILIDHFELLHKKYQNILRVILEKGILTTKFILITNKHNIIQPICSRCFSIKINEPNKVDKYIYFKKEFSLNDKLLLKPFHKLINKNYYSTSAISNQYIQEILDMINTRITIHKIDKIRKLCENIKELDIPMYKLFYGLILNIDFNQTNFNNKKLEIIQLLSYYEYLNLKSYRPLIYLETVILKLNEIIISD